MQGSRVSLSSCACKCCYIVCLSVSLLLAEMKQEIEGVQQGPERNSAEFRIKKAQVSNHIPAHTVLSSYMYLLHTENISLCTCTRT